MKTYLLILSLAVTTLLLVSAIASPDYMQEDISQQEYITALASLSDYYNPNLVDTSMITRMDVNSYARNEDIVEAYSSEVDPHIASIIIEKSLINDVPINIMFAIAFVESSFRSHAINHNQSSSDFGLFQLNDSYRQHWSKEDFFNINLNTLEATSFFGEMYSRVDSYEDAIMAYNAGPYRVINNIVPRSTEMYLIRVLEAEYRFDLMLNSYLSQSIVME